MRNKKFLNSIQSKDSILGAGIVAQSPFSCLILYFDTSTLLFSSILITLIPSILEDYTDGQTHQHSVCIYIIGKERNLPQATTEGEEARKNNDEET